MNYWNKNRKDPHRDLLLSSLKTFYEWLSERVMQNDSGETTIFTIFFPLLLLSLHNFIQNVILSIECEINLQSEIQPKKRINLRLEPGNDDSESETDVPIKTDQFIICGKCRMQGHRNSNCPNKRAKKQRRGPPDEHPGYSTQK